MTVQRLSAVASVLLAFAVSYAAPLLLFLSTNHPIASAVDVADEDTCVAVDANGECADAHRENDDDDREIKADSEPCRDEHEMCPTWSSTGECDANPGYMRRSCRRSCNECRVAFRSTDEFGVAQEINDEPTRRAVEQSLVYMDRVWTDPSFSTVKHKCHNDDASCSLWSSQGECDANPNYMKTHCAPACGTCDALDVKFRCPIHPDNVDAWGPGDLDRLFEGIVDDEAGRSKWKTVVHSRPTPPPRGDANGGDSGDDNNEGGTSAPQIGGPWVITFEDFLTPEECDRLIEAGADVGYERSGDVGAEKKDGTHESQYSDSRTSTNAWCVEKECFNDPLVRPVIERIVEVTGVPEANSEFLQLLKYEVGQYYRTHHDYIVHQKDLPPGPRILTFFLYLNDVDEGGGTRFPRLDNLTVQPKKGRALLWPSVRNDNPSVKDPRTDHEALPVEKGVKYGANAWIHLRDFKDAFKTNCH